MNTASRAVALAAVIGLGFSPALLAQAVVSALESPLLQTAHIRGDPYQGFGSSCLIVYPNGRFHREWRKQVSDFGHAQDRWESPEVFEAQFDPSEIERLRALIETPGMMSISGTIGDVQDLTSKVALAPSGVVPHGDIEILTISIAHRDHPQIFEVTNLRVAERQDQLNTLIEWIKQAEHYKATRLPAAAANNCIALSAMTIGTVPNASELDTGMSYPAPIQTPSPPKPLNTAVPQSVNVELVVNADGTVSQASVKDRVASDLTQSVLDSVRSWKFDPARLLGVPVAVRLQVKIAFQRSPNGGASPH